MVAKITRWLTPQEAAGRVLQDGEGVRTHITMMDSASGALVAQTFADAAAKGARDAARQTMVDHLGSAWQGADAVSVPHSDKEAAFAASIAAAEATGQRIADARDARPDADARTDADAARQNMLNHLANAWRG
jgi:hypothetical protein